MSPQDLDALISGLVGFAVHDDDCTANRTTDGESCSCGLRPILQDARAFLARNEKGEGG